MRFSMKEVRRNHTTCDAAKVRSVLLHKYHVCDPCQGEGPGSIITEVD